MSPEQVRESTPEVDGRTDVYSLGVTLYEGLAGRRPFAGDSLAAIFDAIRHARPQPLRQVAPARSRDAEAVVSRAMAPDVADRYPSALELAADLACLAEGRGSNARARQVGPMRRALDVLRAVVLPGGYRYTSPVQFLGLPLVDINKGFPSPGEGVLVARGWLAVGQVAVGGIAFGGRLAVGGLAFGGLSVGAVALGGLGLGLVAFGGVAVGLLLAAGGMAVGWTALGGMAWGHWAAGGSAFGTHVMSGQGVDPVAYEWFRSYLPWVVAWMESAAGRPLLRN
jgi:hypothetical protein